MISDEKSLSTSKIPTMKKSSVKAVPDFSSLHKKWQVKGNSQKPAFKKPTNNETDKELHSFESIKPIKPSNKPMLSQPTRLKPMNHRIPESNSIKPREPVKTKSTPALTITFSRQDKSNAESIQTIQKPSSIGLPKKQIQKKDNSRTIDDEFNNEALSDILNSTHSTQLDGKENIKRASLFFDPSRKSLGPPRRATTVIKKNNQVQETQIDLSRRSIFSAPLKTKESFYNLKSNQKKPPMYVVDPKHERVKSSFIREKGINPINSFSEINQDDNNTVSVIESQVKSVVECTPTRVNYFSKLERGIIEFRQHSGKPPSTPQRNTIPEPVINTIERIKEPLKFEPMKPTPLNETIIRINNPLPDPFAVLEVEDNEERVDSILKTDYQTLNDLEALLMQEIGNYE